MSKLSIEDIKQNINFLYTPDTKAISDPIDTKNMTISFIALSANPTIKRESIFGDFYISIDTDKVEFNAQKLYLDHTPSFSNAIGNIIETKKDSEGFKVKVKFYENIPNSKEAFERYQAGLSDSVSVGFGDTEIVEVGEIDHLPHYKITQGEIIELSAVWRGADPRAIVSKFAQAKKERAEKETQQRIQENPNKIKEQKMEQTEQSTQNQEIKEQKAMQTQMQANRTDEAREIAQMSAIMGCENLGLQAIAQGKSYKDFRDELYQNAQNHTPSFSIKTSKQTEPNFSIANIIKGTFGVEKEYLSSNGRFSVPNSFFTQLADNKPYDVGGDDTIKSTIAGVKSIEPITYRGDKFIELVKNQSPILSMLDLMPDLNGVQQIPRDDTTFDAYFVEEAQSIKGQIPTFSDIKLTPHTIYAKVKITRQMAMMSPFALDTYIINKITQAIKFKAEQALFYGTSPITGIFNLTGTNTISDYLTKPTYKGALDFKGKLWSNDYDTSKCAFVCNSLDYITLEGTPKFINETNITETERTLLENGKLAGFNVIMNNIIADKNIVLADFSNVIMGIWSNGLEVRYIETEGGISTIECFYDIDFAYKRNNAFVISQNQNPKSKPSKS
ncbi:hypothetical protein BKH46_07485 [Helicobacter sp. 12S02634-8]|uniref:phage major capsid protein n=1 Tax=Helicobacter sp. 12S02634-8 TaxID=1476199 RepID=UPI000BA5DE32|nr:phage major capsid protein [Helicobacter sp. 12S02634-8]PAF46423.1 hypothetical protein BKH46_07485 [Helicobacter sp. 12S02634-8]